MIEKETCSQCGLNSNDFQEGVCVDCCNQNQLELDRHNQEFDIWEKLEAERRWQHILEQVK